MTSATRKTIRVPVLRTLGLVHGVEMCDFIGPNWADVTVVTAVSTVIATALFPQIIVESLWLFICFCVLYLLKFALFATSVCGALSRWCADGTTVCAALYRWRADFAYNAARTDTNGNCEVLRCLAPKNPGVRLAVLHMFLT